MKKEEKTKITREKILNAAMNEFGSRGYYAASINTICEAGINKGLIYHNFKTKDDLYLACIKRTFDDLTASVREEIRQDSSPGYAEARLHFFRTHEMEARLFMEALVWPPKELAAEIRALRSEIDALNQEEFRKILSTCTLRRGVSEEDAFEWFRTMQYAYTASFQMQTTPGEPYDRLIETHEKGAVRFLDRMMFGIAEKKEH
jgi:TetR/AcrR family transcriptional regulator